VNIQTLTSRNFFFYTVQIYTGNNKLIAYLCIIDFWPREKDLSAKCIIEMEGNKTTITNLKVCCIK